MTTDAIFPGGAGELAAEGVRIAYRAGVSANAAMLFGRIVSFNGKPLWELRTNLSEFYRVSVRTITRYTAELVQAGLIVNKPSPVGKTLPGREGKDPLPYRPWFRWAIGLPSIRNAVKIGSKQAYNQWCMKFEAARAERATRTKLADIIGIVVGKRTTKRPPKPDVTARPRNPDGKVSTMFRDVEEFERAMVGSMVAADPDAWPDERIAAELAKLRAEREALTADRAQGPPE